MWLAKFVLNFLNDCSFVFEWMLGFLLVHCNHFVCINGCISEFFGFKFLDSFFACLVTSMEMWSSKDPPNTWKQFVQAGRSYARNGMFHLRQHVISIDEELLGGIQAFISSDVSTTTTSKTTFQDIASTFCRTSDCKVHSRQPPITSSLK